MPQWRLWKEEFDRDESQRPTFGHRTRLSMGIADQHEKYCLAAVLTLSLTLEGFLLRYTVSRFHQALNILRLVSLSNH